MQKPAGGFQGRPPCRPASPTPSLVLKTPGLRADWPEPCMGGVTSDLSPTSRCHPLRIPGQWEPLRVEEEHLNCAQHHCGQALDRPGQGGPWGEGAWPRGWPLTTALLRQSGDIEIVNHKTNDRCQLKFLPYSYFSKEAARKVSRTSHL